MATPTGQSWITWQAPDGSSLNLTNPPGGLWVQRGVVGFGAAPRTVVADALPSGGDLYRSTTAGSRTITLPLYLRGDSPSAFLSAYRALVAAFVSTERLGPGRLVVTRPDGTARYVTAYYSAGLESDDGRGLPRTALPLQLYCPDPYWYAVDAKRVDFPYATGGNYLAPYLTVSPSRTLGHATVVIDGSARTWPTWLFTGPFDSVRVARGDDGSSFGIARAAQPGETWTVVTTPGSLSLLSTDGTNLAPYLDWPATNLFPLAPGSNDLSILLENASSSTNAALTYQVTSDTP